MKTNANQLCQKWHAAIEMLDRVSVGASMLNRPLQGFVVSSDF